MDNKSQETTFLNPIDIPFGIRIVLICMKCLKFQLKILTNSSNTDSTFLKMISAQTKQFSEIYKVDLTYKSF